ncbi:hypothetical protein GGI07_004641 [Coemansia sp. Benny D115]|nr:hypothetical protein GGI07_004641 [Coemansia sp. Benny D115]
MMIFSIGNESPSSSPSLSDSGSVDDSKPNSFYGDSLHAASDAIAGLQDLSPRSSNGNSAATMVPGLPELGYLDAMAAVFGQDVANQYASDQQQQQLTPEASNESEENLYMLGASEVPQDAYAAECCVERASKSRRERIIEPGSGGSAAGTHVSTAAAAATRTTRAALSAPGSPSVSSGRRLMERQLAFKAAADLQRELFPLGVPSQGVVKAGVQCIAADVQFRATGCERQPWHGFVIDDVLFVYAPEFRASESCFRTAVMALVELAEDVLLCSSIIVALPKTLSSSSSSSSSIGGGGSGEGGSGMRSISKGSLVAAHVPTTGGDQAEDWILATVLSFNSEKNRYTVQDYDLESAVRPTYVVSPRLVLFVTAEASTTFSARRRLWDRSRNPEMPRGQRVLGLYPRTTAFYQGTVVTPPSLNTTASNAPTVLPPAAGALIGSEQDIGMPPDPVSNPMYKIQFDDDDVQELDVPAHLVIPMPRSSSG